SQAMRRPAAAIAQAGTVLGADVTLGDGPDLSADVVYHCPWHTLAGLRDKAGAQHVMLYTHTNPGAEAAVIAACQKADGIVCMSFAGRRELLALGVEAQKLWVIPMGVDHADFRPRKMRVGVVAAVQPNGRKREHLLVDLAWHTDLTP